VIAPCVRRKGKRRIKRLLHLGPSMMAAMNSSQCNMRSPELRLQPDGLQRRRLGRRDGIVRRNGAAVRHFPEFRFG
jgi:hypothetical protein